MKAFVTGAGGFVGSSLAELLRNSGHVVTAMARYCSRDTFGWLDEVEGVRKVRGDVLDADHMVALMRGHDIVFHLAALGSVPYSFDAPNIVHLVNEDGTRNVLNAAARAAAKFIGVSSSEVYGSGIHLPMDETHPKNPLSPYARSKVLADLVIIESSGVDCVLVRPFNVFGPRQSQRAIVPTIIRQTLDPKCERVELGNLESCRDLTYVGDTVRGIMLAAELDDIGPWHIGGGYFTSIGDLARIVQDATGIRKEIVSVDERQRPMSSEVKTLKCDATKFTKATGWKPRPFKEGLDQTIEWFRSRPQRAAGYMV